jgi:curli biogenesis system outer membrane secretion channel CsgG
MRTGTFEKLALAAAGLVWAAAGAGCAQPAGNTKIHNEAKLAQVRTIAVLNLRDAPGRGSATTGSGEAVASQLGLELGQCPGVRLIERAQLDKVFKEQDLENAGLVDPSTASKVGKLVQSDLVVMGNVTQYEDQQEAGKVGVWVVDVGSTKRTHRVGVSIRGVDVATGEILFSSWGQGSSQEGYSPAIEQAARQCVAGLNQFWTQQHDGNKQP